MPTRLCTHGRFCSFLAGLQAHQRAARRLRVALALRHRRRLRPSDSQRGHLVRVPRESPLAESPIPFTRNAKRESELGHHVDGQQGGPRTSPATVSRLLQQPLLGPKKLGGLRPVINLKPLNLFIKKEKFKMETTRSIRKALFPGDWVTSIALEGQVFPHSDTSRISEVLQDSRRGQGVPVQSSVFQTVPSPKGILLGHRSPGHPAPQTHHLSSSVLGRLAPPSHVKSHLSGTHPDSTRESPSPGLPSELGQVGTHPDSEVCLPRRGLRCSSWASQAFQGSSPKGSGPLQSTAQTTPPDSSFSPLSVRGSQLCSRHHSQRAAYT